MLTEEEIISGCKRNDKAAQMALYKKYVGKMNALSYRYVNSYDDAKDIVQESFIKVFSSIGKYKGDGSFEGWLRRIIVNASIDYLKKKKKHAFVSIDQSEFAQSEDANQEEDYHVEHMSLTNEELLHAIQQLPEIQQLIFNMHCIEKYSHRDIAETLGIREDTCRSRLRRARLALKEILTQLMKEKAQQELLKGIKNV